MSAQSLSMKRMRDVLEGLWWAYVSALAALALLGLVLRSDVGRSIGSLTEVGAMLLLPLWVAVARARSLADQAAQRNALSADHLDRSGIEMLLGREIVRARRYQRPFSILLGSVQGEASEASVDALVGATQELVRATDEVGAWSESEFLVLLSESKDEQARQLLSRLTAHLEKRLPGMGVRFGIATHAAEDSSSTLVERAQKSLAHPG